MQQIVNHLRANQRYYALLLAAAAVFYLMNLLTTLKGDEYVYALVPDHPRQHCTSLAEFIRTMPFFYVDTNGRFADVLERLMASITGKQVFNLLNTLVFIIFVEGVMTLALARRRSATALLLALAAIAVFPAPGETMLWQAGACNYLWATTASVWLLIAAGRLARRRPRRRHLALLFLAALVAGAFNEATSTAVLAGAVVFMLFNFGRLRAVHYIAFSGYVLGLAVILASPGLWWRLGQGASVDLGLGFMPMITRRLVMLTWMTIRLVAPLTAWALILYSLKNSSVRIILRDHLACFVAGAAVAALVLGMVIERPYFFYATVSLAVVLRAAEPWLRQQRWRAAAIALLLLGVTVFYATAIYRINDYRQFDRTMMTRIADGPDECVIEGDAWQHSHLWVMPDVFSNDQHGCYYRNAYAQYFGKANVQLLSPLMLDRYESGTLTEGAVEVPAESSSPAFASRLFAVPGKEYMLIRVENPQYLGNGFGHVFTDLAIEGIDEETRIRRQLLGTLQSGIAFRPYYLRDRASGGYFFIVGVPYDPTVSRIECTVYDLDNLPHDLTITVKKPIL